MDFEQFKRTKVLIPWFLHCQIWGMGTEYEDINKRVYSYWNGYYIFLTANKNGDYCYDVEILNESKRFENLPEAEKYFWDNFVSREERQPVMSVIKEELDDVITDYFKETLTSFGCSGDIHPDERVIYDNTIDSIATILFRMIKRNKNENGNP